MGGINQPSKIRVENEWFIALLYPHYSPDLGFPRNQKATKQPMCAAANVWSYPVAVNLSIWKERAPGKIMDLYNLYIKLIDVKWPAWTYVYCMLNENESEESGENPWRENTIDLEVKEAV